MTHVVCCDLLLGDGLMATPAVAALRDKVRPEPVEVHLDWPDENWPEHWSVWDHFPGVTVRRVAGLTVARPRGFWWERGDCRFLTLDASLAFTATSGKCHMAYGFAQQLGVGIDLRYVYERRPDTDRVARGRWLHDWIEDVVVLCPVSTSCGSRSGRPANNMIPWEAWRGLADRLVAGGTQVAVAARGEPDPGWPGVVWANDWPIRQVADLMADATAVVTVDTGLAHLACAVGADIVWVRGGRFRSETSVGHTAGRFVAIDKDVAAVTAADLAAGLDSLRGPKDD